jgi:hypothetical protein
MVACARQVVFTAVAVLACLHALPQLVGHGNIFLPVSGAKGHFPESQKQF